MSKSGKDAAQSPTTAKALEERPPYGKEACLVVIYGTELGKKYNLNARSLIIGRSTKCDIQIDQESISRNHTKVVNTGKAILIRDLGSTNGTYVNDEPIDEYVMRDGDLIKIGRTIFKFLTGGNIENAYHEEIYRQSISDPLTQVFNRRYFLEVLTRELARSSRYKGPLSLLAFRLEHARNAEGEEAERLLRAFADELKRAARREDVVARHSDNVLVAFFPGEGAESAHSFCDKLTEGLTRNVLLAGASVSIGLVEFSDPMDAASMLKEGLRRLDAAHRLGGARVVDYVVPSQAASDSQVLQSTFISYGGPDHAFARKLNEALKVRGVQTFFFQDDAPPGDKLHDVMRTGVNEHDRVILVCSRDSLERRGLLNELEETLAREAREGGAPYLLPVRLDDYVIDQWKPKKPGLAQTIRDRVIADFRDHEDPAAFSSAIAKVMAALTKRAEKT